MQALQRFGALVLADLRERSRSRQFWIVLAAMMLLAWWSLPPQEAAYRILVLDSGTRGQFSSAWVGMVLAMAFNLTLNLGGFYLVRGTLVRDIETRVWQLLVATPMTRGGFLLAKWASHMVVFGLIVSLSLAVGLVGQWVRAEDRHIDLIELVKPVLLLSVRAPHPRMPRVPNGRMQVMPMGLSSDCSPLVMFISTSSAPRTTTSSANPIGNNTKRGGTGR